MNHQPIVTSVSWLVGSNQPTNQPTNQPMCNKYACPSNWGVQIFPQFYGEYVFFPKKKWLSWDPPKTRSSFTCAGNYGSFSRFIMGNLFTFPFKFPHFSGQTIQNMISFTRICPPFEKNERGTFVTHCHTHPTSKQKKTLKAAYICVWSISDNFFNWFSK